MSRRFLIVGLDCLGAEILSLESLAELPTIRKLVESGISGTLESVLPPITVPAWTSMLTGRDPGELGIYGFRNRRSYAYGDLVCATSGMVRFPRLWDYVGEAGGRSTVVGVPQTWPPSAIRGELVAGFEADRASVQAGAPYTYPATLAEEVARTAGEYVFDVEDFRNVPREAVLQQIYTMTRKRFQLMRHLLKTRPWDFAMLCEIGPDRIHHCFWSDHDPTHPGHDPGSPHRGTIRDYYRFLDRELGRLLELADPGTAVLVASDHGAQPMHGGVCINELLEQSGWLCLKQKFSSPAPLKPEHVDWSRTRAWAEGGYYARIFLNVEGREPRGIVPVTERDRARCELEALLKKLKLNGGPALANQVVWPERAYRRVRGLAPDLLVFFGGLNWRSIGTIGQGPTWMAGNDTGLDQANHSLEGFYVLAGPGFPRGARKRLSILDVAPTVLRWMGLDGKENPMGLRVRSRSCDGS